jgi:hypothetical protein
MLSVNIEEGLDSLLVQKFPIKALVNGTCRSRQWSFSWKCCIIQSNKLVLWQPFTVWIAHTYTRPMSQGFIYKVVHTSYLRYRDLQVISHGLVAEVGGRASEFFLQDQVEIVGWHRRDFWMVLGTVESDSLLGSRGGRRVFISRLHSGQVVTGKIEAWDFINCRSSPSRRLQVSLWEAMYK